LASGVSLCAIAIHSTLAAPVAQAIRVALQNEPTQLNSTRAIDAQSFFVLGHIFEGLTRNGPKIGEILPGIAQRWEITDQGATFHLREDARWSDGEPVRARDFVFAWRMVVDPANASEYAFIMYPIKNARAIQQRKMPVSSLGVIATDDHTLSVVFEKPCGYFISLTAFGAYYPIREDFYRTTGASYGSEPAALLSDGPFVLTQWEHGNSLRLDKNPKYWNAKSIQLDTIDVPYITPDNLKVFDLYKNHKIDLIERLGNADMVRAEQAGMPVQNFKDGSVWFLQFNFQKGRPTANANLRKAIRAAVILVQKAFISKVARLSPHAATQALIPDWMPGVHGKFREEYPYRSPVYTLEEAKGFVAAAKKEMGGKIPPLLLLTSDSNYGTREAEYFIKLLKNDMGLELRVEQQSRQSLLARTELGEFDLLSTGWAPDYDDPMTFVDLMTSWNANNWGHYLNPEVDRLVSVAQGTTDAKKRMDAMAAAESIILEDVAVIPLFDRVVAYVVNDKKLKGIVRRPVGADPDFLGASVVK
jgi:oligopeptide transport system substrate-binding protein